MQIDKKQEFYQNESIMNYETVKQFNNENLEFNRYENILENL
jgi:ABC-type transport system involved in Fe-S cluster assembly fused permease/ATPase subunit